MQLPPPAEITSEQVRSTSTDDAETYENTLRIPLYRDASGKVWTQPGPGHENANVDLKVNRLKGVWRVFADVKRTRRWRGREVIVARERAGRNTARSGGPTDYEIASNSKDENIERAEHFSPKDVKEALRQAVADLQAKGAIHDPNAAPTPARSTLLSNGLLTAAASAAVLSVAAFAGAGPFAQAGTNVAAPASSIAVSAVVTTAAASVAVGACGANGILNGPEDVTITGAVAAHATEDCGPGPTGGRSTCTVQILPYNATQQSYTYDMSGGFFAGGVHYELHFPGSGIGPTYTVTFPRDPSAVNRGHVTMTSYESFVPASVWQSPDGAPGGSMTWTADTVTLKDVVLSAVASSPKPAGSVTINGTWKVHGCAGAAAGAPSAPTGVTAATTVAPLTAAPAVVANGGSSGGSGPLGAALALAAAAAGAGAVVTRRRNDGPLWKPTTYPDDDPDRELKMRLDKEIAYWDGRMHDPETESGESYGGENSVKGGGCLNIFGILHQYVGGDGLDTSQSADLRYRTAREAYDRVAAERAGLDSGFQPRPPATEPPDDDPGERTEIG